jgi:ubiquinone/menaquinone biosynthesis C-methylase UbiE
MKKQYEENPFENMEDAQRWITSVETEKGWVRDNDIYPALKKWSGNFGNKRVLEIGCGQGICSSKMSYNEYIGIDPSQTLIKRAEELYDGTLRNFFVQSVYDIQFPDKSFDAAFSVGVWFHLENISKASKEISRVLSDNGKFLIITGTEETFGAWRDFYTTMEISKNKITGTFSDGTTHISRDTFYIHTNNFIIETLEENNLQVTRAESFAKNNNGDNLFMLFEGYKNSKLSRRVKTMC